MAGFMNRVKVKICGVRTLKEAQAAIEGGADALGFNFWPRSARYIEPQTAREIILSLPPLISTVGVFVNESGEMIKEIAAFTHLDAIQLHGDESPQDCFALADLKLIKAFRVGEHFDRQSVAKYPVQAVLLDANVAGTYGGTGHRFDWQIATAVKEIAPLILAGGLTIENVGDAIRQVRPMAVDVCSGVESEPGRKDFDKLRTFLETVQRVNCETEP